MSAIHYLAVATDYETPALALDATELAVVLKQASSESEEERLFAIRVLDAQRAGLSTEIWSAWLLDRSPHVRRVAWDGIAAGRAVDLNWRRVLDLGMERTPEEAISLMRALVLRSDDEDLLRAQLLQCIERKQNVLLAEAALCSWNAQAPNAAWQALERIVQSGKLSNADSLTLSIVTQLGVAVCSRTGRPLRGFVDAIALEQWQHTIRETAWASLPQILTPNEAWLASGFLRMQEDGSKIIDITRRKYLSGRGVWSAEEGVTCLRMPCRWPEYQPE